MIVLVINPTNHIHILLIINVYFDYVSPNPKWKAKVGLFSLIFFRWLGLM